MTQDLLFSSRIGHAVERRSIGFRVVASIQGMVDALQEKGVQGDNAQANSVEVILVDLELSGVNLTELVTSIPDRKRTRVVAYGPHGQTVRLDAARQAGCDLVLSRGQLDRDLEQLLDSMFATPQ